MNLTPAIRASFYGALLALAITGLTTPPTQAVAQTPMFSSSRDELPDAPEGPTKSVPKIGFAFRASELLLGGGTAFDMSTTARSLDHPTTALRSDGSYLTSYYAVENGWAGAFGNRNAWTAITANVLLNAGVDRVSRTLYARGGKWRALGYATVLAKAGLNTAAAIGNIRSDGRVDQKVRLATGYRGRILWAP